MKTNRRTKDVRDIVNELQNQGTLSEQLSAANGYLVERISPINNRGEKVSLPEPLLAVDLRLSTEEYEWLIEILRQTVSGVATKPDLLTDLFERYSLVFLAALTGTALLDVTESFWESFWKRLQIPDTKFLQNTIRDNLLRALKSNKLCTFPTAELSNHEYVGLIRLNCGIATKDVLPLVKFIDQQWLEGQDWESGEEFSEFATSYFASHSDRFVTESLRDFVVHLPSRSPDVIARIFEVTDWYRKLKDLSEVDRFEGTHGLPHPTFEYLIKSLSGEVEQQLAAASEEPLKFESPYLKLNLDDFELQLVFPAVPNQLAQNMPKPEWTVIMNGNSVKVQLQKDWSFGGFEEYCLPITSPFSSLQVIGPDNASFPIVKNFGRKRPVLFFRTNGQIYRNQDSVSGQDITAVMPSMARVTAKTSENTDFRYTDLGPLSGWNGWVIRSIPLANVTELGLNHESFREQIPANRKSGVTWIEQGSVIPHLYGVNREVVHRSSPSLQIPKDKSTWTIRYFQEMPDGSFLDMEAYEVEDELREQEFELFESCDDPWVGQFRVEVWKDQKLHERRSFNLAEGLECSLSFPSFKSTGRFRFPPLQLVGGHSPKVLVKFSSVPDAQINHDDGERRLKEDSSEQYFKISSKFYPEEYFLNVYVIPPQLQYRAALRNNKSRWTTSRSSLDIKEFDDGNFELRFPQQVSDVTLQVLETGPGGKGRMLGAIAMSKASSSNVWSTQMRRLRDLMSNDAEFLIIARWSWNDETETTHSGYKQNSGGRANSKAWEDKELLRKSSSSCLASVSKKPLVISATANNSTIELTLSRETSNELEGWVWSILNPLAAPIKVQFKECSTELPDSFNFEEPLLVEAQEKAFLSQWRPTAPSEKAVFADQGYALEPRWDPLLNNRWLFSTNSGKVLLPQEIRMVWDSRYRLRYVLSVKENRSIAVIRAFDDATESYLLRDPRVSLDELDKSSIPSESHFEAFIRSGLSNDSFEVADTSGDIHRVPWIGLIQEMNDLCVLNRKVSKAEEIVKEKEESENYIKSVGGLELWSILMGNTPGLPLCDKHIPSSADLASVRDRGIDVIREQLEIAPMETGFISEDSRVSAQVEWLENQRDLASIVQLSELFELAHSKEYLIDRLGDDKLKITARNLDLMATEQRRSKEEDWLYAPYISFVLSLLVRMDAHGVIHPIDELFKLRHVWATCARSIPALTGFDLVSAEAKVLNWKLRN